LFFCSWLTSIKNFGWGFSQPFNLEVAFGTQRLGEAQEAGMDLLSLPADAESRWRKYRCARSGSSCVILSVKMYNKEFVMTLTVSSKGWIVIPAELRKKYHLTPGTEVVIVDYGGVLSIIPAMKDPIKAGRGLLKDLPSLTKDLLEERRKERKREEARMK
jgi:AbrB family looped-hinge helix DNA binding protein